MRLTYISPWWRSLTCAGAATAGAQSRPAAAAPNRPPRVHAMINGGFQPSTTSFDDSFTFTLYQETGTTEDFLSGRRRRDLRGRRRRPRCGRGWRSEG